MRVNPARDGTRTIREAERRNRIPEMIDDPKAGVPKASSKIALEESRIGRFLARVKTIGYNRFSLAQRKRPVKLNGHSLLNHILISPHLSSAKKILYSI
ncbi:hypothetical protein KQX54_002166 [Cotesia glomerata]|uniref:Uncharacterized protein n=1 Tax=Cotesia glomerata TaxID=32391 RepID=A0AAV7IXP1_COTGL|nr:hypothetical protein KQX54_002166 [Cotesia glomerata]